MVFSEVGRAAKLVVFRPWILIPLAVAVLISLIISRLTAWVLERPLIDLILNEESMQQSSNIIFTMMANYPVEIIVMIVTGLFVTVITVMAWLAIVGMVNKKGFAEAINDAVLEWKKSIAVVVFAICVLVLIIAFIFILGWIIELVPAVGTVVAWIIGAIMAVIALTAGAADAIAVVGSYIAVFILCFLASIVLSKFVFTIPALIEDGPKKAFAKNLEFTKGKYWGTVLFLGIVFFVVYIIGIIFTEISYWAPVEFEEFLFGASDVIGMTFFVAAISIYYFIKRR